MKKVLVPALFIALCWALFLGASDPRVGLSSQMPTSVGLSNELSSAMSGSRSAVDTISVLLTYATGTHDQAEYNTFAASADSTILFSDIGFRYTYFYAENPEIHGVAGNNVSWTADEGGWGNINYGSISVGNRKVLMYVDPTQFVPSNANIISFKLKFATVAAAPAIGAGDSLSVTLMSNPADTLWISGDVDPTYPLFSQTSWHYADLATSTVWPTVNDSTNCGGRPFNNDWGEVITWFGNNNGGPIIPLGDVMTVDITAQMQAALAGYQNSGLVFGGQDKATGSLSLVAFPALGSSGSPNGHFWFEVEYETRPPVSRFPGGKNWAFVFSTDDGVTAPNETYTSIFEDRGKQYTIFVVGKGNADDAYGNQADYAQIVDWYDRGMEIGYHSTTHRNVVGNEDGLSSYDGRGLNIVTWDAGDNWEDIFANPLSTGYDSLLADCDPTWFTAQVESVTVRADLSGSSRWLRVFALPFHDYTQQALVALDHVGFVGVRGSANTNLNVPTVSPSGDYIWPGLAAWTVSGTQADSVNAGGYHPEPSRVNNLWMTGINLPASDLVGTVASPAASYAEVRENLRVYVENFVARGRDCVQIYTHNDIDSTTLEWLLDAVDELGGATLSVGQYIAATAGRGSPADLPLGYGQNDTLSFAAEDRAWFTPPARVSRPRIKISTAGIAAAEPITLDSWAFAALSGADTTAAGDIEADITAETSGSSFVRLQFAEVGDAFPDTTGLAWSAPAAASWTGAHDTGILAPVADPDSGGIRITWSAATGHTGYILEMSHDGGAYVEVTNAISPDSTGYTHQADDAVPPRRGRLDYRLFSFSATDTSAAATHDSTFHNQATGVYARIFATPDTSGADSLIVAGETLYRQFTAGSPPPPPDLTAPDTTGVFAGVTVDTTTTSDVLLTLADMTIGEPGQVQFQWSNDGGSTFHDAEEWNPATASTTVGDTIHTGVSTAAMNAALHTRFRLRDDEGTPNVSGWVAHQEPFTRASAGGGDYDVATGYVYIDNATTASNVKVAVYDASDNLLGVSDGTAISGTPGWVACTFSTTVTLTAGADYRIGFVADGYYYPASTGAAYAGAWATTGSYATPVDPWAFGGNSSGFGVPSVYVTNAADTFLCGVNSVGGSTSSLITGDRMTVGGQTTCATLP